MARILTEGFEMGDLGVVDGMYKASIDSSRKRTGSYGMFAEYGWGYIYYNIPESSEIYTRAGYYHYVRSGVEYAIQLCGLYNGATPLVTLLADFDMNLYLQIGTGTPVDLGYPQAQYSWALFELYAKIDDMVGVIRVKKNGILIYTFEGDTKPGLDTVINRVYFGAGNKNGIVYDDIAINDTTGLIDNSWCGDGHIIALKPTFKCRVLYRWLC